MSAPESVLVARREQILSQEDAVEDIAHAVSFAPSRMEAVRRWLFDENHLRHLEQIRMVQVETRCAACFSEITVNALVAQRVVVSMPDMDHPRVLQAPMFVTFPTELPMEVMDLVATATMHRGERGFPKRAGLVRRFAAQAGYHAFMNHCPRCNHPLHDTELFSHRGPFTRRPADTIAIDVVIPGGAQVHCGLMLVADVSPALMRTISAAPVPDVL